MGGYGSGWHRVHRPRVESAKRFDVSEWQRDGKLEPGCWQDLSLRLRSGEYRALTVTIERDAVRFERWRCDDVGRHKAIVNTSHAPLYRVPVSFGGSRAMVGCPSCGRRCRILYFQGGDGMLCRLCLGLRYRSQNMAPDARCHHGMAKIALRLDPHAQDDSLPDKPKWMRWATYERFAEQYERYQFHGITEDRLERLLARLGEPD